MKLKIRVPVLLLAVLALFLLAGCYPAVNSSDGLVVGSSYRLDSGETLNHDLMVVGGNVTLDQNSTVNGDVSVLGGNVNVDGSVNGDLTVMGGSVNLDSHAVVQGTLNSVGGSVRRASGSIVRGQTQNNTNKSTPWTAPTLRVPTTDGNNRAVTSPLMAIFQSLAMAALAVIVTLFVPVYLDRTGQTALAAPVASGGVGCLTLLVLVVMAITIILIPVSLLGLLAAGLAILFGWIAVGLLVGRQLTILMKKPWSDPISAGIGTLFVSLLASALNMIPCIGWVPGALLALIGLGAVVLSRAGTQIYPSPYGGGPIAPRPGSYPPAPGVHVYGPESDQPRQTPPPMPPAGPGPSNM